jgi:two-component system response regulator CpxR
MTSHIFDDDGRVPGRLVEVLARENPQLAHASNSAAGLARGFFDLLVLDVMIPEMDEIELPQGLRMRVLLVTATRDPKDRILAMPLSERELVGSVRAMLRRIADGSPDSAPLAVGALAMDPGTMSVTLAGVPVRLTTAEFKVLEVLARSSGRVQSRETLTQQALGRWLEPFDRSVDTHISNIRRKLCLYQGRGIEIKSSRGRGYVLTVPRRRTAEAGSSES